MIENIFLNFQHIKQTFFYQSFDHINDTSQTDQIYYGHIILILQLLTSYKTICSLIMKNGNHLTNYYLTFFL
jgi:hypothetical protein